jgi:hypothetical protein
VAHSHSQMLIPNLHWDVAEWQLGIRSSVADFLGSLPLCHLGRAAWGQTGPSFQLQRATVAGVGRWTLQGLSFCGVFVGEGQQPVLDRCAIKHNSKLNGVT